MTWLKRIVLIASLTLLALGGVFAFMHDHKMFDLRSIPVEVAQENEDEPSEFTADASLIADLKKQLDRKLVQFKNKRIWEVRIGEVERSVMENEWVAAVRVSRLFPDRLAVEIRPRAPVFLLQTPKGHLVPVTADGRVVRTPNLSTLPDVPVLKGERFYKDAALRSQAVEFIKAFPETGALSRSNIAEIDWSTDDGFTVTLLPSRTKVVIGVDRVPLKVARVEQIIDYLSANQLQGRVVDASFSKKVLVRLRKGP